MECAGDEVGLGLSALFWVFMDRESELGKELVFTLSVPGLGGSWKFSGTVEFFTVGIRGLVEGLASQGRVRSVSVGDQARGDGLVASVVFKGKE